MLSGKQGTVLTVAGFATFAVVVVLYSWLLFATGAAWTPGEEGRVRWGTSSMVLTIATLGCLTTTLSLAGAAHSSLRLVWWLLMLWAVVVLAIGVGCSESAWLLRGPVGGFLSPLFEKVPATACIVHVSNVLGGAAVLGLIVICGLLSRDAEKVDEQQLGERIRAYRAAVVATGVFLAVAIYQLFRLYEWGAVVRNAGLADLASSQAMGRGLLLSTLLTIVVLPTGVVLHGRFTKLLRGASSRPGFDQASWMTMHDLSGSPLTALSSYVAVLAPAVTGLFTRLLDMGGQ